MATTTAKLRQPLLIEEQELPIPTFSKAIHDAVSLMANAGIEERGAVFTRQSVVNFILDLAGYTSDRPLESLCVLEPSFGQGDFLIPIVERLLESWATSGCSFDILENCLRAVELHSGSFNMTRGSLLAVLERKGLTRIAANYLLDKWLIQGDFLLLDLPRKFDFVLGNPPYVRQERIPELLLAEYRRLYSTLFDRADLYIPFIERGLTLLNSRGRLGFICADRWLKNRYGGPLRKMIAENYSLNIFVDMVDADAFESSVTAYPAITIISSEKSTLTRVAHGRNVPENELHALAQELTKKAISQSDRVTELHVVKSGDEPWMMHRCSKVDLVRRLEESYPTLEEVGCKVGIGVATGADAVFIGRFDDLDVEESRKIPLAMTKDIKKGYIDWTGSGVINPFDEHGLVNLSEYPKLNAFLTKHKEKISNRHVAKKSPVNWYRTIDRITPELTGQPKLLIPDIKGDAHIVYDEGRFYPHHNLYYLTSEQWDLRALQTILKSGIAKLFVSVYSTKMRGGYLRFQAQYIRRIRIPCWSSVPDEIKLKLSSAADTPNIEECNQVVFDLFDLSTSERQQIANEA